MKILQVIPFFAPAWAFGGPVKVCYQISKELEKSGHEVTVLTTDTADGGARIPKLDQRMDGFQVKRFRNLLPGMTQGYNLFTPLKFKSYLKKHIKEYDIIHCHSFFTYLNIVSSHVCRTKDVPYIVHLHESPVPLDILGKKLIKRIFNLFFGKKILSHAAKIVVVSNREKQILSNYWPRLESKIIVVPNPIDDCQEISPVGPATRDHKNILCLARLSHLKGVDLLINAFSELIKDDPSYRLIIAGPDENGNLNKLKQLCNNLNVSEFVQFPGLVEGQRKEDTFAKADIFALFSLYESFSVATLEAVQHGLPCCLSSKIGIAEQVRDGHCGLIVEDIFNAKEGALTLKQTYEMKTELSKSSATFLNNFSIDKIYMKILKIYKEILS